VQRLTALTVVGEGRGPFTAQSYRATHRVLYCTVKYSTQYICIHVGGGGYLGEGLIRWWLGCGFQQEWWKQQWRNQRKDDDDDDDD
jgi:hypothetical protein